MQHNIFMSIFLLIISNVFMTFAWYGHLKNTSSMSWYVAIITSWSVAFFEYCFQVPANRIGFASLSLSQLKMMQEVISLSVFVPFAIFFMHEEIKLDYLWASFCILGAVFFVFRAQ